MKWTSTWATAVVAFVAGCGSQVGSNDSADGSTPDAGADRAMHADVATDVSTSSPDGGRDAASEADKDSGKPPYDGGNFDNCAMNPCGSTQVCVNYLPNPSINHDAGTGILYGTCQSVSTECEPHPTCFCLLETAECSNRMCNDDGGVPILTCTITPPP
jgi:hypothetical protein